MKNFINNIAIYWDNEGNHAFTNVGYSKTSNKKQNEAISVLVEKLKKLVKKECKKINKLV